MLTNPNLASIAKGLLAKVNESNPIFTMSEEDSEASEMMAAMMKYMPLRALVNFSQGAFTEEMLGEMIEQLNGQLVKN